MSSYYLPSLESLVEHFESLPSIGHKSAQRLAYFVLKMPKERAESFAKAIVSAKENIHYCKRCCNFTDKEKCPVAQLTWTAGAFFYFVVIENRISCVCRYKP